MKRLYIFIHIRCFNTFLKPVFLQHLCNVYICKVGETTIFFLIFDNTCFFFISSGVMKINKNDGTHEVPIGPPVFGRVNGIAVIEN